MPWTTPVPIVIEQQCVPGAACPNGAASPTGNADAEGEVTLPDIPATKPDVAPIESSKKGLKVGATLRGRYDLRFNDVSGSGAKRTSSHLSFDTLALTADYTSDRFFGAAQYRFYGGNFIYGKSAGYREYPGEVRFLMYAYGGARLTESDSITAGIQPVPFDDRYWGSSILDDLAFVYGFEETYNLGVKFRHETPRYRVEVGFFPSSGPAGGGISSDSSRYSTNISKADSYVPDGSRNDERNMLIGNVSYTLAATKTVKLSATISGWLSTIHNFDTRADGSKRIFAASLTGSKGPWHAKTLVARQDIDPRNPGRNDMITVGGFDVSYNIATKGTYVFGELGRSIDTGSLPFNVTPYVNYGRFFKDAAGFKDSERLDIGAVWSSKKSQRIKVYSEFLIGRNDPYVGAGQFISGAAQGGDGRLKKSILVIFGYSI